MKISKRVKSEKGFTLIEALVAMGFFAFVSAFMAPAFILHLKTNTVSEQRNGAIAIAQQILEELRSGDPSAMPNSGTQNQTRTLDSRTYSIDTIYCATATYCTSRSRHIGIKVSYQGKVVYQLETAYAKLR